MKRLAFLTITAVIALPLAGCSNTWPRCWGYRGDQCNVCTPYESAPVYGGEVYPVAPPTTQVLPGPAETQPST
jgi:hypothetical protein